MGQIQDPLRELLRYMGIEVGPGGGVFVRSEEAHPRVARPLTYAEFARFYKPNMATRAARFKRGSGRGIRQMNWHKRPVPMQGASTAWWYGPSDWLLALRDPAKMPAGTPTTLVRLEDGTQEVQPLIAETSGLVPTVGDTRAGWHWIMKPLGVIAFHAPSVGALLNSERSAFDHDETDG